MSILYDLLPTPDILAAVYLEPTTAPVTKQATSWLHVPPAPRSAKIHKSQKSAANLPMLHNHLHITMHVYDTWWIDITIYLNLQQYYLIMSHLHTPLGGAPSRRWVERWRVVANGWPAALDDWRVRCLAAFTMAQLSQHWLETISQGISINRFNRIQSNRYNQSYGPCYYI